MRHSLAIRTLFLYLVAIPGVAWAIHKLPGIADLLRRIQGGQERPPLVIACLCLVAGFVVIEIGGRGILVRCGRRRAMQNELPVEKRSFSLAAQIVLICLAMIPLLFGAVLFDRSPYASLSGTIVAGVGNLLWVLGAFGDAAQAGHTALKGSLAACAFVASCFWLATPLLPRRLSKDKIYQLEMYNPFLAKQPFFSKERLILRYFRKLWRVDYLNRFNLHTVFAGVVRTIHGGIERMWYVTYDERNVGSTTTQRMLTPDHFNTVLKVIRDIDTARHGKDKTAYEPRIANDIIIDVAREFDLKGMAEQTDEETPLGDLTAREVELIIKTLAQSRYNNVLTLDVRDLEQERPQQTYNKRLVELVSQANRRLIRLGGAMELSIYRRDKRLSTKILQFRVDPQESLRRSIDEYGDRLSPRRSLLYATIRGAAGEHGEFEDDSSDIDADDIASDDGGDDGDNGDNEDISISSASTLDHIEEVNPSAHQMLVQGKGLGRVYDIQLGKESYQVITEWLRSLGADPVTGWRSFRISKVIDSDGNTVALRRQRIGDFLPHVAGLFGLGKEFSHLRITDPKLHGNDKFAMVLLALDIFESREFRNRKRILRTAPIAEAMRNQPEE